MRRDLKILVLILIIPLALYGTAYAYGSVTMSTYRLSHNEAFVTQGPLTLKLQCDGDGKITGGGYWVGSASTNVWRSYPSNDNEWTITANGSPEENISIWIVCMPPITVAGIGVPEFSYLYIPMILGAVVYALLTRISKMQLVPTK